MRFPFCSAHTWCSEHLCIHTSGICEVVSGFPTFSLACNGMGSGMEYESFSGSGIFGGLSFLARRWRLVRDVDALWTAWVFLMLTWRLDGIEGAGLYI
jgi:hypothetical protein